jgi:Flp pilus assembly protein CpaB
MRKVMLLGIAAVLALVAAATWAATVAQTRDEIAATRINTFELMVNSKDLPTQQYDMH